MSSLGSLVVSLSANTAQFTSDMGKAAHIAAQNFKKIEDAAKTVGSAIGAYLGVQQITQFASSVLDSAERLNVLSERTGIAVRTLAGLEHVATQSGASVDDLAKGFRKLAVSISEAGTGGESQRKMFEDLGMKDAAKGIVSVETALYQLAEVFPRLREIDQTRVAVELLGKSGDAWVPVLRQGKEALDELLKAGQRLNPITAEQARLADDYRDSMSSLGTMIRSSVLPTMDLVLPVLKGIAEELTEGERSATGYASGFDPLKETFRALIVFGGNVAFVLKGLGVEIGGIAAQLAALARGDFKGAGFIGEQMKKDAAQARRDFDAWENQVMNMEGRLKSQREIAADAKRLEDSFWGGNGNGSKGFIRLTEDVKKSKKEVDDHIRQMQQLGKEYESVYLAAEKRTRLAEAQIEKGRELTASEEALLDIESRLSKEWVDSLRPLLERAEALEKQKELMLEAKRLYEDTRTPMEKLANEYSRLQKLQDMKFIDEDTYARGIFAAQDAYDALVEKSKTSHDQMTEFAIQAARNMQDAFADFFFDAMQGKFSDLVGSFKQTIDRMVANLLASQLMNFLTGDFGKTGVMGGFLGEMFSGMFPGRAIGGPVSSGTAYRVGEHGTPEIFIPSTSGTIVPESKMSSRTVVVNNHFTISQPTDRRTQEQIASLAGASIQRAMSRGS